VGGGQGGASEGCGSPTSFRRGEFREEEDREDGPTVRERGVRHDECADPLREQIANLVRHRRHDVVVDSEAAEQDSMRAVARARRADRDRRARERCRTRVRARAQAIHLANPTILFCVIDHCRSGGRTSGLSGVTAVAVADGGHVVDVRGGVEKFASTAPRASRPRPRSKTPKTTCTAGER